MKKKHELFFNSFRVFQFLSRVFLFWFLENQRVLTWQQGKMSKGKRERALKSVCADLAAREERLWAVLPESLVNSELFELYKASIPDLWLYGRISGEISQ